MVDLTLFDYLYVGVVVASTFWAFLRGGVYEMIATISWLVAAITSRFVSPNLNEFFQKILSLPEPTIGTLIASYFVVFFGVLVVFGLFNQRLRDWIQDSILQITDRTLGVIFGILRAIVFMGLLYWAMLWYYEGAAKPAFLIDARSRSVVQLTAVKLNEWFVPGKNKLLENDMAGAKGAQELYNNLIEPAIKAAAVRPDDSAPAPESVDPEQGGTGYKESERNALENQLLQLDNAPEFEESAEPAASAENSEN